VTVLDDALLIAGKDLRIEARSKVTLAQVGPFAVFVLVLFAFALGDIVVRDAVSSNAATDSIPASMVAAGLYWLAVLFAAVLAIQRAFAIETTDGAGDALRLSVLTPAGIFLGKALAIGAQLLALEAVLAAGIVLFFDVSFDEPLLFAVTAALATVGIAAVGTCHGALSAGLRVRDSLLPLLFFPVIAPVLIGAVRATEAALSTRVGEGWLWVRLLVVFAAAFVAVGVAVFGPLLEES
jgi:heme exporter protein B